MRVDLALKYLCLVKSRSQGKSLAEHDNLLINGKRARASAQVRAGDQLTLVLPTHTLGVELIDVPQRQLSKSTAPDYYRILDS